MIGWRQFNIRYHRVFWRFFHRYSRNLSGGTPLKFHLELDTSKFTDYTPRLSFSLIVANIGVLEINIKNFYHGHHCPESCCSR